MKDRSHDMPTRKSGRGDHEVIPVSFNQQARLRGALSKDKWLRNPSGLALRISGPLGRRALQDTLTGIARRHSALRTFFPPQLAPSSAACAYESDTCWPVVEVDCVDPVSALAELSQTYVPFVPADPPLLRASLASLSDSEHILALAVDHMNFDGISGSIVSGELVNGLRGLSLINSSEISATSTSRFDKFVEWERKSVAELGREARGYWANKWGRGGPYPEIPFPNPKISEKTGKSEVWQTPLDRVELDRLKSEIKSGYFTDFMLVTAAVMTTTARAFSVSDPAILFPFANRTQEDWEDTVGYFSNRLILRPGLTSPTSFRQVAVEVRACLAEAIYYGWYPHSCIAEEVFPELANMRPRSKYILLNTERVGQRYIYPGGYAEEISLEADIDMTFNPGMFITYVQNDRDGACALRCQYSPNFYSSDEVDLFMSEAAGLLNAGK